MKAESGIVVGREPFGALIVTQHDPDMLTFRYYLRQRISELRSCPPRKHHRLGPSPTALTAQGIDAPAGRSGAPYRRVCQC